MEKHLYLRAPREKGRPPAGMDALIHLDEPGVAGYPLHHRLEQLPAFPEPPGESGLAFLAVALGVWAADKFFPRAGSPDGWTRRLALHLPVTASWLQLAPELATLLHFLTGDFWTLKLREGRGDLKPAGQWPHAWHPDAVALFSGGLDSLVGALDRLEAGERLLLVSHYDFGQLAATQQALGAALRRHYGPERLHSLTLRVQLPVAPELTLRSRSLLYLALGLASAAAFGPDTPLLVPENGWISLNPPLTLNRLGAYSTRTTHPFFLKGLSRLWRQAGLNHPLANPYQQASKGEMLAGCANRALLRELFPLTVSCSRPVVGRWQGESMGSCGYCYPCLMRRAALHRLGWDRGEDYRLDVLGAPEHLQHRGRGSDLRALLLALKTWEEAPQEIMGRLWLGDEADTIGESYAHARQVLDTGFQEIGRFFRDKGPAWIRSYMQWE
jgi:7-cyano-7-deazaguanine synthase in queuosine biosynthesis